MRRAVLLLPGAAACGRKRHWRQMKPVDGEGNEILGRGKNALLILIGWQLG